MPLWKRLRARVGNSYRKCLRRDVPILTFHRIRPVDGTGLATLGSVLDYVASEHRVLTLSELTGVLRRGGRIPRNAMVLTFDDGTRDQYELAAPELNKRGLRATFGVIGCTLLERSVPPLHWYLHLLETTTRTSVRFGFQPFLAEQTWSVDPGGRRELAKMESPLLTAILAQHHSVGAEMMAALGEALQVAPPTVDELFMSLAQIRSLQEQGHEPAGHSLRHQDVDRPDQDTWARDLQEGFALMNEAFGTRSHPYIYPFGTERRLAIHHKVQEAGFCCAATTEWGTNRPGANPYALRRVGVDNDTQVPLATVY